MNLLDPFTIENLTFNSRIMATLDMDIRNKNKISTQHLIEYGILAKNKPAAITVENIGVSENALQTNRGLLLNNESQIKSFKYLADLINDSGAVPIIQLTHVGINHFDTDKAYAPSATGNFREMTSNDLYDFVESFVNSARLAEKSGFQAIEIKLTSETLLFQFLQAESNTRDDYFGGNFENNTRLLAELIKNIQKKVSIPIFVRSTLVPLAESKSELNTIISLAKLLEEKGIKLINFTDEGLSKEKFYPGYFTKYLRFIKKELTFTNISIESFFKDPYHMNQVLLDQNTEFIAVREQFSEDPFWLKRFVASTPHLKTEEKPKL